MLEQLISLKKAMKENKEKAFVYERFQDYFFWYESLNRKGIQEKIEFMEIEREYLDYMNKPKEEKE